MLSEVGIINYYSNSQLSVIPFLLEIYLKIAPKVINISFLILT